MSSWKKRLAPFVRPLVLPPLRAYFRHAPTNLGKAALWRLASHTQWLETQCVVTPRFRVPMRVDARDTIGRYIAYFGVWEPHLTALIEQTLRPGDAFVDVGANVGYFSLLASTLVGEGGSVVAIEAAPQTAALLAENVRGRSNVRTISAAAWDANCSLDFYVGEHVSAQAAVDRDWTERWNSGSRITPVTVAAAPLSEMLTDDELKRTRMVKIDVEGAEAAVLRGLLPAIDGLRDDALIVCEVTPELGDWNAIREMLEAHGFGSRMIENDYTGRAYFGRIDAPALYPVREDTGQFDAVFARA